MKIHLLADGRDIDAVTLEKQLPAELGMPAAWDEVMRMTHNAHAFSFQYAAGLYVYLWADVLAADDAVSVPLPGKPEPLTPTRFVALELDMPAQFEFHRDAHGTVRALSVELGISRAYYRRQEECGLRLGASIYCVTATSPFASGPRRRIRFNQAKSTTNGRYNP